MNRFEFLLALVFLIGVFGIIRARMGLHTKIPRPRFHGMAAQEDPESKQLQEEVRQLKERIQVLERITVDKENSLARQIDELRDR